jgi:biopolymer transport protein ExbD/biopolymer transport protein TolR
MPDLETVLGTILCRKCLYETSFPTLLLETGVQMKDQETQTIFTGKRDLATPNINVTPPIDVLLVLLIIFMMIQPQKEAKFEAPIPQKPDTEKVNGPVSPSDLLMIDVKTGAGLNQVVELNSKPLSLMELGSTLRGLLEQRPNKTVYIKAPKEKQYGDVVQVIDVMKGAGALPIGLQIDFLS